MAIGLWSLAKPYALRFLAKGQRPRANGQSLAKRSRLRNNRDGPDELDLQLSPVLTGAEVSMTQEEIRLAQSEEREKHWKRWGPYLSERAWGTVREDYSPRAPRGKVCLTITPAPVPIAGMKTVWRESAIAGRWSVSPSPCGTRRDPILKERLFGLTGNEGNHGEDVKEYYFYLDSTPTHSYMKYLYKYPQAEFPYAKLVSENRQRDKSQPEYELMDTGVFDEDRYFDVFVEYAKADVEDILIKITVSNRGPEAANLRLLPTIWFRNTWSWGEGNSEPRLKQASDFPHPAIVLDHPDTGKRWLHCEGSPELLFTENETNARRLFAVATALLMLRTGSTITSCMASRQR